MTLRGNLAIRDAEETQRGNLAIRDAEETLRGNLAIRDAEETLRENLAIRDNEGGLETTDCGVQLWDVVGGTTPLVKDPGVLTL